MAHWPNYTRTRYEHLGYARCDRGLWRLVALDDAGRLHAPPCVGPLYRTRAELLGDLADYARFGGYQENAR